MIKITSLALLLVLITGCKNNSDEMDREEPHEINYLALGDSYTVGESVAENERWPVQLVAELKNRGYPVEDPRIIATTGWTTRDLLNVMENELEDGKYELISISIGVNNQYQGRSLEEYEEELREIFRRALELSRQGSEGVFALSIPDYGVTPFGKSKAEEISRELEKFNAVFEEVSQEYGVDFYNITPISKRAADEPKLTAEDDLHPSGEMYELWVEEIIDEVERKLNFSR